MNVTPQSVLVVDDEPGMREALEANFQREGWQVQTASGHAEAMRILDSTRFPLVITDVRMPDGDGLNLMRTVRKTHPSTAVVVLTAFGTVPDAVRAMRDGACDYLTKPVRYEDLRTTVNRVMTGGRTSVREAQPDSPAIIGNSPALLQALDRARHAAVTNADVLIEAESGTGKELLARFIHENSARRDKPFVAINCAAVPETLLESELFGHTRGAFTGASHSKAGKFELASGGTILLDEIGDMPLGLQPKLLRVLQERKLERLGDTRSIPVDIRVVATTNASLQDLIDRGAFRADLYYRLNVIPLSLPALRDRREDIGELAHFFAERFAADAAKPAPGIENEFIAGLQAHEWPGNVREFANFMRRVVTLNDSGVLGPEELSKESLRQPNARADRLMAKAGVTAGSPIREVERRLLQSTLQITDGNRTRAAEMLGISVRTIRNKIREYGLPPRRFS